MKSFSEKFIIKENSKVNLDDYDPAETYIYKNEEAATGQLQKDIKKMRDLQAKLYAGNMHSVLIVLQAMDAAGKDGLIKHVMSGLNPQGTQVTSFKHPNDEELEYPFLWRVSRALPKRGIIGIFNRSHYEEVLICKVHPEIILHQRIPMIKNLKSIDKKFWKSRYEMINAFETYLNKNGTMILKFFLNISHQEQKKRFLARIDDHSKNWKFSFNDISERGFWDKYMDAYESAFEHTSSKSAPWFIIPADNKWFTRVATGKIIVEHLEKLHLKFPRLPAEEADKLQAAKKKLMEEKN